MAIDVTRPLTRMVISGLPALVDPRGEQLEQDRRELRPRCNADEQYTATAAHNQCLIGRRVEKIRVLDCTAGSLWITNSPGIHWR
jgi:hypothetical protein